MKHMGLSEDILRTIKRYESLIGQEPIKRLFEYYDMLMAAGDYDKVAWLEGHVRKCLKDLKAKLKDKLKDPFDV